MAEAPRQKRKAAYYRGSQQKRSRRKLLNVDMRGFLCTCNGREKDCVAETYNLLNRYADALYGSEKEEQKGEKEGQKSDDSSEDLEKELEALRDKKARRFQVVDSGARNVLFIKTTLENPVELAEKIMTDVQRTQQQQSRFLIRLVPIEVTCRAYEKDIEKAMQPLLEKYFKSQPRTFGIAVKRRNNTELIKDEVIQIIAKIVEDLRPDHKVNLDSGELYVLVEIIGGVAMMAVVPDYMKYKKYNVHALSTNCIDTSSTASDELC